MPILTRSIKPLLILILGLGLFVSPVPSLAFIKTNQLLPLKAGWKMQSSAFATQPAQELSLPGASVDSWWSALLPNTVLGVMIDSNQLGNPYLDKNFRKLPGCDYPEGGNFAKLPMPDQSPFKKSWFFRNEFLIPEAQDQNNFSLHLDGINYRANVWMNGKLLIDRTKLAGMFRLFELDVTKAVVHGQKNVILIEVFAPEPTDLATGWVDWAPMPGDKNMGIYRDIYLSSHGAVALRSPQVITDLKLPQYESASLTLYSDLRNTTDQIQAAELRVTLENIVYSKTVSLAPRSEMTVSISPDENVNLILKNPRVWWPAGLGDQPLYLAKFEVYVDGRKTDAQDLKFGIRKIESNKTNKDYRLFSINGKNILIRGAGWQNDLFYRTLPEKTKNQLRLVKNLGINTIRLEGHLEDELFFDECDRLGLLVMAGWSCCDHWENWKAWDAEDYTVSAAATSDQIKRLRNHPSVMSWSYGSDFIPIPKVEKKYLEVLAKNRWPNPSLAAAHGNNPSAVTGTTGVKMTGPYEFVAPAYWMQDTGQARGGAYGFNSETSPGMSLPPIEGLSSLFTAQNQWPAYNPAWLFHGGGSDFQGFKFFDTELNRRFGKSASIEEYLKKAELQSYEGHRAMFEAFARNKYTSTGVIQWMLNSAWPSTHWHLFDFDLRAGGAFYGAQEANRLVHILYSYDDHSVAVVNHKYQKLGQLRAQVRVLNLDLTERFKNEIVFDAGEDSSQKITFIPPLADLSDVYFVDLRLFNSTGEPMDQNFYWLSKVEETLNWKKTNWYRTETLIPANYQSLSLLPQVSLQKNLQITQENNRTRIKISITNPSTSLALMIRLKAVRGADRSEVLPVLLSENDFSLLPGENRLVTAELETDALLGQSPDLEVSGFNINRN